MPLRRPARPLREAYLEPGEQEDRNVAYAEQRLVDVMEGHGVAWKPLVVVGHAADEIATIARKREVDIVLTATRGHRGLKRMLLGSVTERLMRILPCPLLIIPAAEEDASGDGARFAVRENPGGE